MKYSIKSIFEGLITNILWAVGAIASPFVLGYLEIIKSRSIPFLFLIIILIVIVFFWKRHRFVSITGITKVEHTIAKGTRPTDALMMCNNNFRFLGIAANKFIYSEEFEKTIKRCNRSGESIKFLLSSPDNPIIKQMARRAKREENDFRNMIISTLDKLRKLKTEHGYNIEVRLYKSSGDNGPPSFRLFFIDNSIVLVSYYFMGDGDGSGMPQIIIQRPKNGSDVQNFYFAFDHYFNSLWTNSEEWNFMPPEGA